MEQLTPLVKANGQTSAGFNARPPEIFFIPNGLLQQRRWRYVVEKRYVPLRDRKEQRIPRMPLHEFRPRHSSCYAPIGAILQPVLQSIAPPWAE
ncbi:MAG: hypothetical protein JWR89_5103 [Tardiphaga sp.]|nr:hypothetical protein [Tardiphaga sp.]